MLTLRTVHSRSVLAGCDGQVTDNSTVDYNGNPIGHVTATCPQSGSKKRSKLEDRGVYNLCTEGNCECFPQSQLRVELLGQE